MASEQIETPVGTADDVVVLTDGAASGSAVAEDLRALAVDLFTEGEVLPTLARLLEVTTQLIPVFDAASITVAGREELETVAYSHGVAREADDAQRRLGEGPVVAVTAEGGPAQADHHDAVRWPSFTAAATELGVRRWAVHGFTVAVSEGPSRRGSLNLYSFADDQAPGDDRRVGTVLAAHAGVLVAAADERRAAFQRERDLHRALVSRDVIGQAKGVLMERQGLSAEQAFDVLRRASMRMNVKLRDLAERVIDGEVTGL